MVLLDILAKVCFKSAILPLSTDSKWLGNVRQIRTVRGQHCALPTLGPSVTVEAKALCHGKMDKRKRPNKPFELFQVWISFEQRLFQHWKQYTLKVNCVSKFRCVGLALLNNRGRNLFLVRFWSLMKCCPPTIPTMFFSFVSVCDLIAAIVFSVHFRENGWCNHQLSAHTLKSEMHCLQMSLKRNR